MRIEVDAGTHTRDAAADPTVRAHKGRSRIGLCRENTAHSVGEAGAKQNLAVANHSIDVQKSKILKFPTSGSENIVGTGHIKGNLAVNARGILNNVTSVLGLSDYIFRVAAGSVQPDRIPI